MIVWPGTLSVQPLPKIGHAVGADERLLPFGEGRVEHHLDPTARVAYHLPDGVEGDDEAAVDPEKEGMVHMAGMAALMTLMLFVLFNDIRNLL